MQNDLISRTSLITRLAYYHAHSYGKAEYAYGVAVEEVVKAPAIDAVPVVHGMWSDEDTERYVCTVCGCWFFIDSGDGNMNYCPNCGAKMDGGEHHAGI